MFFLLLFIVSGCASYQSLDPKEFYKRDIEIEINGTVYEGVTVIPRAPSYDITLKPKGDLDLILIRSCHREYSGEKKSSGFLGFKFGQSTFKYTYHPVPELEDRRVCPLRVDVYESSKGRHSWAFLDFEHPDYVVKFDFMCNGTELHFNGVGVCQAKAETVQRITFKEPIRFAPVEPSVCYPPKKHSGNIWDVKVQKGECIYHFDTKDGKLGRLTVVGWSGIALRSSQ